MTELSKYNLRYKNVLCIAVDWAKNKYYLRYNKKIYLYKETEQYSFIADTDKIRFIIAERFLKKIVVHK